MQVCESSFVHYPRTGGRFVNAWLESACDKPIPTSMTPASDIDGKKWGIIRNPFDFYVSYCYFDSHGYSFVDFLRKFCEGKFEYYWLMLKFLDRFDIGVATYCFIYFFCDWRKALEEQSEITDLKPYIIVDKIIKYEPDLIEKIKKEFDLTLDEKYLLNKTQKIGVSTTKKPFMNYYNNELIDYVKHKDRLLFKLYPEYECDSN